MRLIVAVLISRRSWILQTDESRGSQTPFGIVYRAKKLLENWIEIESATCQAKARRKGKAQGRACAPAPWSRTKGMLHPWGSGRKS